MEPRDAARVHELKTLSPFFQAVRDGDKTFEVRKNDRGFRVGDTLELHEWDERNGYTGRAVQRRVTYVLPGDQFGIEAGYVVMGIA